MCFLAQQCTAERQEELLACMRCRGGHWASRCAGTAGGGFFAGRKAGWRHQIGIVEEAAPCESCENEGGRPPRWNSRSISSCRPCSHTYPHVRSLISQIHDAYSQSRLLQPKGYGSPPQSSALTSSDPERSSMQARLAIACHLSFSEDCSYHAGHFMMASSGRLRCRGLLSLLQIDDTHNVACILRETGHLVGPW